MDTCAVETGLLKKHPCGQNAVAKCANCEMALCSKHAVAQLSPTKQRTGKFMCAECDKAQKAAEKGMAAAAAHHPAPVKPAAPGAKPPAGAPAATPAAPGAAAKAGAAPAAPAKPHDSADDPLELKPTNK